MKIKRQLLLLLLVPAVLVSNSGELYAGKDDILSYLPAILFGVKKNPPLGIGPSHIIAESPDRMFENPGQWPIAIKRGRVWKYYGVQVETSSDWDWSNKITPSKLVAYAQSNNMKIGCEFGDFVLGVDPTFATSRQLDPIFQAGGKVDMLHLDGPVRRLVKGINQHPMALTLDGVADYLVDYWIWVHDKYPDLDIGLITNLPNWDYTEDLPGYNGYYSDDSGLTYAEILDAVYGALKEAGEKLAFVEVDCPYNFYHLTDNKTKFRMIKKWCRARGIRFHIVTNSEASGAGQFQVRCQRYLQQLKADKIRPDLGILQSWYSYPSRNIPESTPFTFTDTINALYEVK